MTSQRHLRGLTLATLLALPFLPGCMKADSTNNGPGGVPSGGAPGSTSGDKGSGSGQTGSSLGGSDTEPKRGSAASTGDSSPK